MISITKGEQLLERPDLFVYSPTGEYSEVDLIQCYEEGNPGVPLYAFQAQYVKYGSPVYHQDQPLTEEQVTALEVNAPIDQVINNEDLIDGKIDPESLAVTGPDQPAREYAPKAREAADIVEELGEGTVIEGGEVVEAVPAAPAPTSEPVVEAPDLGVPASEGPKVIVE